MGKKIVVLSDNVGLARAIELNLNQSLGVEVAQLALDSLRLVNGRVRACDADLMVVAISASTGGPAAARVSASLAGYVGQVPLLVISDRPFETDPEEQIVHLRFPFSADALYNTVRGILQQPLTVH